MSPDDVGGIAIEHGHEFTADKITQLSKEELEDFSGGILGEPGVILPDLGGVIIGFEGSDTYGGF